MSTPAPIKPPYPLMVQDMPPPGGFGSVDIRPEMPKRRGPHPIYLFAIAFGIMGYYLWDTTINERPKRAKRDRDTTRMKINLIPLLQAEEDLKFIRKVEWVKRKEAEIMSDIPGWVPQKSPYHNKDIFELPFYYRRYNGYNPIQRVHWSNPTFPRHA
eukprot:TRINITY_DN773_c0_g1_i2.p1 TRINITY_DN773_c0_g1~~TRINITY_DN773_c0_g1_i2.p1  ORF type:complete len:157 (+),score=13.20 TRINITY_DN773_c0_g1_i2:152-622(+)